MILSTKLSIYDYNAFLILTKLEYQAGLIKEESPSELLRFTIRYILNQLYNNLIYPILEEEQEQQRKDQNNQQQQQIHSQVILPSTITATTSHQSQVPNISRRNNLVGQKMTPWKSSLLLSMQTNHHTSWW
jgi:hypothetical protein